MQSQKFYISVFLYFLASKNPSQNICSEQMNTTEIQLLIYFKCLNQLAHNNVL